MRTRQLFRGIGASFGLTLALAACSGDSGLRQLNTPRTGPDEFRIVPNEPLQEPENYTFLPAPTLGGANLGDPNPAADAVAALGGNPAAVTAGGAVPSRDTALVTQSSRYGVTPQIRQILADADAKFRKQRGRFSNIRIVPVDRYNEVYETFALDPFAEAERWRQTGRRVPAAPPTRPQ